MFMTWIRIIFFSQCGYRTRIRIRIKIKWILITGNNIIQYLPQQKKN